MVIKLSDDEEKLKILEKVKGFLMKLERGEISVDKKNFALDSLIVIEFEIGEDLKLKNRILVTKDWILAKTCLMFFETVPDPELFHLMCIEMLKANFEYPEVTYSVDDEGNMYIEADMPSDTTFENFESEFNSILFGTLHFYNTICPNVSKEIYKGDTWKSI